MPVPRICWSVQVVVCSLIFAAWCYDTQHDEIEAMSMLHDITDTHRVDLQLALRQFRDTSTYLDDVEHSKMLTYSEHGQQKLRLRAAGGRLEDSCDAMSSEYDLRSRATDEIRERFRVNEQLSKDTKSRHADKFRKMAQENARSLHEAEQEFSKMVNAKRACEHLQVWYQRLLIRISALSSELQEAEEL
mmetsp:Transcript_28525/g.32978  ORF Transcript_28525/g.32978 Transcript_28525/m.32978 type:complete len:189 (+) Transcript_28525:25-591(+)|eukprot:CAMPEP_0176446962 /NCGR_PEP_ID=MMETSP0127-20121128/24692_1 /TAXON_ID=938130 /ORGANISM="Platyophrya macrostoma, Strain WH" /LENGTH=188 /DNA_ID=CAMNT_0017833205 /DNA_START=12 /DNA_END=578 /DNA_ORIENTATION=+